MNRRRVAFVEFPPAGGLYQFSAQLAAAMAERGHEVHLYTGPRPELVPQHPNLRVRPVLPTWHPADPKKIHPLLHKVRRVLRAGQLVVAWVVLLAFLARDRPGTVIWSNWRYTVDAVGVLAARRLLRRARLGLISHEPVLHNQQNTTVDRTGRVLDPTLAKAWASMDVVFVLGEEPRRRVLERWKVTCPVVVIPHGDENALRGDAPVPDVADTGPNVLFFGTWSAYKGIDVLLDAVPAIRAAVPDAKVVVAGAVYGVDLPALQARADALGVETHPGYVPAEQVPVLFGAARVVVTPYKRATQSGVVHLAYTFDRPVVATSVGELPSVVHDGETGLLVPPDDAPALAAAVVELLTDAERAHKMGLAGARWLTDVASWAAVAERMDAGLTEADAARAGAGR
ncbi:glycosyltransferase family 4 protein [Pseudonocardia sp.]|uniref:glycosyltransferase family 4 protein n=1 Tax=Pseudonocardia sp. TaxID=60912 RepID=UPI003D10B477